MDVLINVPDNLRGRLVNGLALWGGYQEKVVGGKGAEISNPETKEQFARRMVKKLIEDAVVSAERENAIIEAKEAVVSELGPFKLP